MSRRTTEAGRAKDNARRKERHASAAAKPPPPPPSHVRLRVVGHMVPTAGPRDDSCAHYGDCLTAHIMAHKGQGDVEARCPFGCRWYVEQEQAPATSYQSLQGEARGLPPVSAARRSA